MLVGQEAERGRDVARNGSCHRRIKGDGHQSELARDGRHALTVPLGVSLRQFVESYGCNARDKFQHPEVIAVTAAAEIMRRMNLKSAIVVSDGYHIFRVKKMLESSGLMVFGSPRPSVPPGGWQEQWQYYRQALGYLLWRVGINI